MGRFQHVTPHRLQIRDGGGCLSLFGMPFLAAGLFVLLSAAGVIPVSNANDMSKMTWPALMLLGTLFTVVGGVLVFGRSWTTIDIAQRTVSKQLGLLVPLRERTYPLGDYTAVTIGFVEGDSDSADKFPVALKARSGADLQLSSFTVFAESREYAAAVARHLQLDIEDRSTDHPVRLTYNQADLPLQHRLALARDSDITITRPANARSEVGREDGAVRIVIPQRPMHPVAFASVLIPMAMAAFFLRPLDRFFRGTNTPDPIAWIFFGFIVFLFGFIPAMSLLSTYLRSRRGAAILLVSPQGIRIEERGVWRTRTTATLDASDILDVDYGTRETSITSARRAAEQAVMESGHSVQDAIGPRTERMLTSLARYAKGRGLTVKTRHGLTTIGKGLEDDETRYLYGVIRRALEGRPG
jgi:hypothetical protein